MSAFRTRVATLNTHAGVSIPGTLADLARMLTRRPHFLGFQEVGGIARALAMRVWLAAHGYGWTQRHGRNRNSVPITHRRRTHKRLAAGAWHLSDRADVGKAGAGPSELREKWATWAVYHRRRTHLLEAHINAHLAPSIGVPEQPDADVSRAELHAEQVERIAALIVWLREHYGDDLAVHVSADWNTANLIKLHPIMELGLKASAPRDTMHHAPIDRVLSTGRPSRAVALHHLHTDHAGLVVTAEVAA